MKKGLMVILVVFVLTVLLSSAALANIEPPGEPVGGCPNENWTLTPLKWADPAQVALDHNLDGYLCVKKNVYTKVLYFIDNKYALP